MVIKYNIKRNFVIAATVIAITMLIFSMSGGSGMQWESQNGKTMVPLAAASYNVSFRESGLPNGTAWHITLSTPRTVVISSTQYVNFTGYANGSYFFTIPGVTTSTNSYTPTPSTLTVIISGSNVHETVSFYNQSLPPAQSYYNLYMNITNLPGVIPTSTQWSWSATVTGISVSYSNTVSGQLSTLSLSSLINGTYGYSISTTQGTSVTPSSGQFTVSGKNVTILFKFALLKTYEVKFVESGLPASQSFSVYLTNAVTGTSTQNSTTVSISDFVGFSLVNQSYDYFISPGSSFYTASPSSGELTVNGSSVVINVSFHFAPNTYIALFSISNPPTNTPGFTWSWYVVINGTLYTSFNATDQAAGLTNGTYSYYLSGTGIAFSQQTGSFTVNGSDVKVILHALPTYSVTFRITNVGQLRDGAPVMTSTITDPVTKSVYTPSSSNGILTLQYLPNGSYTYALSVPLPYALNHASGTFTINGKATVINLTATEGQIYIVQFWENGIPMSGTSWGVVLDNGFTYNNSYSSPGLTSVSSPSPFVGELPNGSYFVQAFVQNNGKYYFTQPQQISVSGHDSNVTFNFQTATTSASPGISGSTALIIGGIVAAVIVVGIAAALYFRRGKFGGQSP